MNGEYAAGEELRRGLRLREQGARGAKARFGEKQNLARRVTVKRLYASPKLTTANNMYLYAIVTGKGHDDVRLTRKRSEAKII